MHTPSAGTPSGKPSAIHTQKSPCPICGQPKTPWSLKCSSCEANRQRYMAAVARQDEDRQLLQSLTGRTLQSVADEKGVKRQRIHQLKADAQRRLTFLAENPIPPLSLQTTAA